MSTHQQHKKTSRKRDTATKADIQAFMEAVFPEAPHLAMLAFDERQVLRAATRTIHDLRAVIASLRETPIKP